MQRLCSIEVDNAVITIARDDTHMLLDVGFGDSIQERFAFVAPEQILQLTTAMLTALQDLYK